MSNMDFNWSHETKIYRPKFSCSEYLPILKGHVNMLSAPGGFGKSFVSIILALHFLKENPFSTAYIWSTEDEAGIAKDREIAIVNKYLSDGVDFVDTSKRICYGYRHGRFTTKRSGVTEPTPFFAEARDRLVDFEFVVIDPLLNFFGGDSENDNLQVRSFMTLLSEWANVENKTIVTIHHGRKDDGAMRGASAFSDASRIVYNLSTDIDGVKVESVKGNYLKESVNRVLDIIPAPGFWAHDEEYGPTSDVTFSYSKDMASGFRLRSAPFSRIAQLAKSEFNYSAAQFDGGYRNSENAAQGQTLMILDYDDGLSIDDARKKFADVRAVIATTRNHRKEKNGKICDRFRVIMQCAKPIALQKDDYREMMRSVVEQFGSDPACINNDRFYYGAPDAEVEFTNGMTLFDWERFWYKAQAKRRTEQEEYDRYRVDYSLDGSADSKKRGRDTYADAHLMEGARNVTLYKLAKFAERDGCSRDEIVAEITQRGMSVGLTAEEIALITREYR